MKHLNAISGGDHLSAMESHTATIACEGFNLADLSNRGRDFVMSIADTGSKAFEQVFLNFFKVSRETLEGLRQFKFSGYDTERKYGQVMHLRVQCPEGFKGNVLDYTNTLKQAVQQALRVQPDVLIPLEDFLSKLVSVPGYARDTKTHLRGIDKAGLDRVELVRQTQKFFNGSSKATAVFSELYRNMNEWQAAYDSIKQIQDQVNSINHEELLNAVQRITKLIQMVKVAHEAKELENMSKTVITELSTSVYEAAKQVEQLSITLFAVYVLSNVMNDTAQKV